MQGFNIGINSADNGVFLPDTAGQGGNAQYHRTLHTDLYYQNVEAALNQATTQAEAIEILSDIRGQLENGTFQK